MGQWVPLPDPCTLPHVEANERTDQPQDEERPAPGDRTVSIWEYLEKDEAAGGKTYRGSHRVEDQEAD
jgi:hypothetical protein